MSIALALVGRGGGSGGNGGSSTGFYCLPEATQDDKAEITPVTAPDRSHCSASSNDFAEAVVAGLLVSGCHWSAVANVPVADLVIVAAGPCRA